MRWVWPAVGILIAAALQTLLIPELALPGVRVRPDLLLLVACLCGLYSRPREAIAAGWVCGFTKDLFSAGPLGSQALIFALCAYGLTRARQIVFRDHPLTQVGVAALFALLCESVSGFLVADFGSFGHAVADTARVIFRSGIAALYAAILAPFVFQIGFGWRSLGFRIFARVRR